MNVSISNYVIITGIYDILCAASILKILKIPILDKLHISMYYLELNSLEKRFLAYWIFTYGYIRLLFGIAIMVNASNKVGKYIIIITYLIEAFVIANESVVHNRIHFDTALSVITLCLLSAIFVYIL